MITTNFVRRLPIGSSGRVRLCAVVIAALLGSAGCTTLGGNVSGDFACRAPGGSCSPMSAIDARAVESVLRADDAGVNPNRGAKPRAFPPQQASGPVGRTSERTLRVVFPAHVDAAGVLHDEATAHVVVEDAAWAIVPPTSAGGTILRTPSAAAEFEISRSPAPSSLREAIAGANAPAIEGLESLPAQAPHPIIGVDVPVRPITVPGPTPEALAAARAGRRITRPGPIDLSGVPLERSRTLPAKGIDRSLAVPATGKPPTGIAGAIAAGRVRALAGPAISQMGSQRPSEPDLDGVFAPAAKTEGAPK